MVSLLLLAVRLSISRSSSAASALLLARSPWLPRGFTRLFVRHTLTSAFLQTFVRTFVTRIASDALCGPTDGGVRPSRILDLCPRLSFWSLSNFYYFSPAPAWSERRHWWGEADWAAAGDAFLRPLTPRPGVVRWRQAGWVDSPTTSVRAMLPGLRTGSAHGTLHIQHTGAARSTGSTGTSGSRHETCLPSPKVVCQVRGGVARLAPGGRSAQEPAKSRVRR